MLPDLWGLPAADSQALESYRINDSEISPNLVDGCMVRRRPLIPVFFFVLDAACSTQVASYATSGLGPAVSISDRKVNGSMRCVHNSVPSPSNTTISERRRCTSTPTYRDNLASLLEGVWLTPESRAFVDVERRPTSLIPFIWCSVFLGLVDCSRSRERLRAFLGAAPRLGRRHRPVVRLRVAPRVP